MKKFNKVEKTIIAMSNDDYETYTCSEHGVFQKKKDSDDGKCPYGNCEGEIILIDNIKELKEKFKKELNFL
jgi:hypothetical protein